MAVTDATVNRDFYNVTDGDGSTSDWFEKELGTVESAAETALRKVLDDGVWPLEEEDRDALAIFVTFQILRGPDQRNAMGEIATRISRTMLQRQDRTELIAKANRVAGRTLSDDEFDEALRVAVSEFEFETSAATHISQLANIGEQAYPLVAGRQWNLVRFAGNNLLTCDTPVSLAPHSDAGPDEGLGIANAWAILLPLSRTVGLMMVDPTAVFDKGATVADMFAGRNDVEAQPTADLANVFNRSTIYNARQWIYHHPDDGSLVPEDLPKPRASEMRMDPDPETPTN